MYLVAEAEVAIFTENQMQILHKNRLSNGYSILNVPVVHLSANSWSCLISEIDYGESVAFGLIQDGTAIDFGDIPLDSIRERINRGEFIFNDPGFLSDYSLETFKKVALIFGRIEVDEITFENKFQEFAIA